KDILRADLDGAAAARMEPGRAARHDLQSLARRACRRQNSEGVRLGVENVDRSGLAGPVTAAAGSFGQAAAQPAGCGELIFRLIAFEYLSDLEQRCIGKTAVGIALRRHDEARNEARPHVR